MGWYGYATQWCKLESKSCSCNWSRTRPQIKCGVQVTFRSKLIKLKVGCLKTPNSERQIAFCVAFCVVFCISLTLLVGSSNNAACHWWYCKSDGCGALYIYNFILLAHLLVLYQWNVNISEKESVLYESGDWSNQGFSSQSPVIMFLWRSKRKENY